MRFHGVGVMLAILVVQRTKLTQALTSSTDELMPLVPSAWAPGASATSSKLGTVETGQHRAHECPPNGGRCARGIPSRLAQVPPGRRGIRHLARNTTDAIGLRPV